MDDSTTEDRIQFRSKAERNAVLEKIKESDFMNISIHRRNDGPRNSIGLLDVLSILPDTHTTTFETFPDYLGEYIKTLQQNKPEFRLLRSEILHDDGRVIWGTSVANKWELERHLRTYFFAWESEHNLDARRFPVKQGRQSSITFRISRGDLEFNRRWF